MAQSFNDSMPSVADIAEIWRRGSVVSSWLLDLTAMALVENPTLSDYSGFVQDPARAAGRSKRRSKKRFRPKC